MLEKSLKIIFGLLLIVLGFYLLVRWWGHFLVMLKGFIPVIVVLVGLVFVLFGFEK